MGNYAKYVVSFGLILPNLVGAVGLGNLSVESSLNRPLKAYVKLLLDDGTPLNGIKIGLASSEAFNRAGLERPYVLSHLSFSIVKHNGIPVVKITSMERMDDPYMNILLDVTWAKGQFYRAYTVLLDPPGYSIVIKKKQKKYYHRVEKIHRSKSPLKRSITSSQVMRSPLPVNENNIISTLYGPTTKTDDLWKIALRYKPQNTSINQVMLAIVQLNKHAFVNGNVNGLKEGIKLKIPTYQVIIKNPRKEASLEVDAHMKAWREKKAIKHVLPMLSVEITSAQPKLIISESSVPIIWDSSHHENKPTLENINETVSLNENTAHESIDVNDKIEQTSDKEIAADEQIKVKQTVPEQQKLTIINQVKSDVIKEPLFDDFIHIPQVLKEIVKQPKTSGKTQKQEKEFSIKASKRLKSDIKKNISSEVAVAVSAIASVKESNQLLRQQVNTLARQNELLQQRLVQDSKRDENVGRKIELLMKLLDKDYVVSSSGTLISRASIKQQSNSNDDSFSLMNILYLLGLLLTSGMAAGFGFLYLRQQKDLLAASSLNEDVLIDPPSVEKATMIKQSVIDIETPEPKKYTEAVISNDSSDKLVTFDNDDKNLIESVNKKQDNILESASTNEKLLSNAVGSQEIKKAQKNSIIDEKTVDDKGFKLYSKPLVESKDKQISKIASKKLFEQDIKQDLVPTHPEVQIIIEKSDHVDANIQQNANKSNQDNSLDYDLSGIDLASTNKDLNKTTDEAKISLESSQAEVTPTGGINMSTQIALAETYIAMEDWQSAKASLQEAVKGGTKSQIKKAKSLLKSIP